MQKRLILLAILALPGCSNIEFPWVYRINIDQGNIITQDMVDQLKPGMSKSQVQFVMGSALIADTFHEDRWDYLYSIQNSEGERKQHRLSVFFQNDKLVSLNGDFLPGGQPQPAAQAEDD